HSETHATPLDAWRGTGFLPRLPDSLEDLDLLLVMHAKARVVRRDGIRFQGLRYSHATLAAYVGDAVTIRYDPRDLSEIRVFHHEQFLCRAVSEAHAGEVVTLQDIQAARRAHRRVSFFIKNATGLTRFQTLIRHALTIKNATDTILAAPGLIFSTFNATGSNIGWHSHAGPNGPQELSQPHRFGTQ